MDPPHADDLENTQFHESIEVEEGVGSNEQLQGGNAVVNPTASKENVPVDLDTFPCVQYQGEPKQGGVPTTIFATPYDDLSTIANDTIGNSVHPGELELMRQQHRLQQQQLQLQQQQQEQQFATMNLDPYWQQHQPAGTLAGTMASSLPHSPIPPALLDPAGVDGLDGSTLVTNGSGKSPTTQPITTASFSPYGQDSISAAEKREQSTRRKKCLLFMVICGPMVTAIVVGVSVGLFVTRGRDNPTDTNKLEENQFSFRPTPAPIMTVGMEPTMLPEDDSGAATGDDDGAATTGDDDDGAATDDDDSASSPTDSQSSPTSESQPVTAPSATISNPVTPVDEPAESPTSSPTRRPQSAPVFIEVAPVFPPTFPPVDDAPRPVFPPTFPPVDAPTPRPVTPPTSSPVAPPTPTPIVEDSNPSPATTPTSSPVDAPTPRPVTPPTSSPVNPPTPLPTPLPTPRPTNRPTLSPTKKPTQAPTKRPTQRPTLQPVTPRPTARPTAAPITPAVSEEMLDFVQVLEDRAPDLVSAVDDQQSAQFAALEWLTNDSNYFSYSDARLMQRYALATFAFGLTNLPGSNWLDYDTNECDWFAKASSVCSNGIYTRIDLRDSVPVLGGSIPKEISLMSSLTLIYLQTCDITGTLPSEIQRLDNLVRLQLTRNRISGTVPSELGRMANNLSVIGLGRNEFVGTIPTEIASAEALRTLGLEYNQLRGTIPPEIGNMPNLTRIYVNENLLTGQVPSSITSIDDLEELNVSGNNISGSIRGDICGLPTLTKLIADCNEVSCECCTECSDRG